MQMKHSVIASEKYGNTLIKVLLCSRNPRLHSKHPSAPERHRAPQKPSTCNTGRGEEQTGMDESDRGCEGENGGCWSHVY